MPSSAFSKSFSQLLRIYELPRSALAVALFFVCLSLVSCAEPALHVGIQETEANRAPVDHRLAGTSAAISYSGYREGQHPDRGQGAQFPSREEVNEDLDILIQNGFRLIRLYDAGENSHQVLKLIEQRNLPIRVLLGAWLKAELSNHERCPWLDKPIPIDELQFNRELNAGEIANAIDLANAYPDIVVAVNVGNEALVEWTDHLVDTETVIDYVREVKSRISQPVTVADSYEWWLDAGQELAKEIDFLGIHSYPVWQDYDIDQGLERTLTNVEAVREAYPDLRIAVLEAGWPDIAQEFGERASAEKQTRYYNEIRDWAADEQITVFFFEAFDEPWKGNVDAPLGAEKHWGLFYVDRTPKPVMEKAIPWFDPGAVAWAVNIGGEAYTDVEGVAFTADTAPAGGASAIAAVIGIQDGTVYQSYREGEQQYRRSLDNGIYDVTLLFAEPRDIPIGDRVFDVLMQQQVVIQGLDVRSARDGNPGSGLTRTVTGVVVDEGELTIALRAGEGEPILSGILVRSRTVDPRQWSLVWNDEFDYEGAPDPDRWSYDRWKPRRVNEEDQAYTDRSKNVRVSDGRLVIEAHREDYDEARYTSGRIHSRGKGDWLYGRVDLRARLPGGQGTWPAMWMLPTDAFRYASTCSFDPEEWQGQDGCDAWPNSGEIDIMEHVGYDMHRLHGTVHNKAYYWKNGQQRKGSVEVRSLEQNFHVYSLEWSPEIIRIYYDGVPYFAYLNDGTGWESWPYDHPYHLIINLAVGGQWGRAGGPIDDSIFPVKLEVDYVRVFEAVSPH